MLNGANTIFMLGIEGSGMRGLAFLLSAAGAIVKGSDDKIESRQVIDGYEVMPEEDSQERLSQCDVLIFSDAVKATHPLRVAALQQHIRQLPYQEALGEFAKAFEVLAVTGTHGKSSTTAMLAHILIEADLNPSVLVGASVPAFGGRNARAGKSNFLVIEADEFRRHFLTLSPTHMIITTIDFDHPDYFSDIHDVEEAYSQFIDKLKAGGVVITRAAVSKKHQDVKWPVNTIMVTDEVACPLPGVHMRQNAALAVALAEKLGVSREQATTHLQTFSGLNRRMEKIGTSSRAAVYSDYGHHPHEIGATITGAREAFADKKIGVVVEPHMIERLETYFDDYVQALCRADSVLLCPVFYPKGREGEESPKLDELAERLKVSGVSVKKLESYDTLHSMVKRLGDEVDIVVAFTAGVLDSKLRQVVQK